MFASAAISRFLPRRTFYGSSISSRPPTAWRSRVIANFSDQTKAPQELKKFQKEDPRWTLRSDKDSDLKLIKDELVASEAAASENLRGNKYEIARTLNDMGLVFMQTNKYEKAEQYLLRAVELLLELKHPFRFQALENLVGLYFQEEQYLSGIPWLVKKIEAYSTSKEKPGLEQYRNDLWNLSEAYWKVGQHDRCVTYLKKLLELAISDRGEQSEAVATVRQELGITYLQLKKFDEALKEVQEARGIAHSRFGSSHVNFARALALEAQVFLAKGDTASALALQKQVLAIREALTPANPLLVALGLSELAETCARAGDLRGALNHRRSEEQVLSSALQSPNHPKLNSIKKLIRELEEKLRSARAQQSS